MIKDIYYNLFGVMAIILAIISIFNHDGYLLASGAWCLAIFTGRDKPS